jgi:large subunit ribosomal protein L4
MAKLLGAVKVGTKVVKKGDQAVEQDVTLADTTVLIGTAGYDPNVYKSGRNLPGVKVLPAAEHNAYALHKHKRLVLTKAALEALRKPKEDAAK